MEILYYFKPFNTKNNNNQVDYFLFLLAVSSKYYTKYYTLLYCYTFNYVNFLVKKESKSLW